MSSNTVFLPLTAAAAILFSVASAAADAPGALAPADTFAKARARMLRIEQSAEAPVEYRVQQAVPCTGGTAGPFPCDGIDLLSFLPLNTIGGGNGNDIWGWTDPATGTEYALMGRTNGTAFVDISDPENPVYVANLPTQTSNSTWRDIKTRGNFAFIVSEAGGHGMQVFDLTQLAGVSNPPQTLAPDTVYSGFGNAHNIVVNEDSGFAYAVGTSTCSGGLHMVDISNATSPQFAGCVSSDGYTHDAQCVNYVGPDPDYQGREICINSNEDTVTIYDVTDKAAPVQVSRTGYAGAEYTHQGWLTEDHRYFLLDDELDEIFNGNNTRTRIWDMTNLDAPVIIGVEDGPTSATDHNQYVHDGKVYQANYRAGLRVFDLSDIANGNLIEAGFFDIYPQNDSASTNGAWSVYPYFDSGTVVVSGIEQGLFMVRLSDNGGSDFELQPALPGVAGEANTWTTLNGTPGVAHLVFFGFAEGSSTINIGPCQNVTTGLVNARGYAFGLSDAEGSATAFRNVAAALAGVTVYFQAIDLATCQVSNTTATTF
ncbi:MAG: choice-of-anchor B family protein [Pseudomonadota bacterium]